MPYKTGSWGIQAKNRAKRRRKYHRDRYYLKRAELIRTGKLDVTKNIGSWGEIIAEKLLGGKRAGKKKWDIDWHNKKVEVKTARPSKNNRKYENGILIHYTEVWKFWIKTQLGIPDYYILICLNKDKKVMRIYFIPSEKIKNKSTIRIATSNRSKNYLEYLLRLEAK